MGLRQSVAVAPPAASVLDLPPDVIARIGAAADGDATRNAFRLAHSQFRGAHHGVHDHALRLTSAEGCQDRIAACLRVKPWLKRIEVDLDAIHTGWVDLAPLQPVPTVLVSVFDCGPGLRVGGVSGKHAMLTMSRAADALSAGMLSFVLQQDVVTMLRLHVKHRALAQEDALMRKVVEVSVYTWDDDDDEDRDAVVDLTHAGACRAVHLELRYELAVQNPVALTHLDIMHPAGAGLALPRLQAWLNASAMQGGCRLKAVKYHCIPWNLMHDVSADSFAKHLVDLVHRVAPAATLALDVVNTTALRFVQACVPKDMSLQLLASRGDCYLAARLAQAMLLRGTGKHVPMRFWEHDAPRIHDDPARMTTVQQLYETFQSDEDKRDWHLVTYMQADAYI